MRMRLLFGVLITTVLTACGGGGGGGGGVAISSQPSAVTVYAEDSASFSVAASGAGTLAYQWRKDGLHIDGANASSYSIASTAVGDSGQYSVVVSNDTGSIASNNAELRVNDAQPGFSSQPAARVVDVGQAATFGVTVTGKPTIAYQWRKNGTDIAGATAATYTTPVTVMADNGAVFSVRITNSAGASVSNDAVLSVTGTAPSITTQPDAQTVGIGQPAVFSVTATGNPAPTYQWRRNEVDIAGATSDSYTTPATTALDHQALYSVAITNEVATVLSSGAALRIVGGFNAASSCGFTNTSSDGGPLLQYAWHIKNNNQYFASNNPAAGDGIDLCMGGLWEANTLGAGVKVNVVDTGLELAHEDLSGNILADASYNFVNSSKNPTNTATNGDHGTSVAGLIAASRNTVGGTGVAPKSGLMGYNFLSAAQSVTTLKISFGLESGYGATSADIFNFSAGTESLSLYSPAIAVDAIYTHTTNLRSGKGALFIKSAGNGFEKMLGGTWTKTLCNDHGISCQNANQDAGNTMYNAVVVAALAVDGKKSSYSTTGSAIWISGFGGEYGYDNAVASGYNSDAYKPAMLTTDQSGCGSGYSRAGQDKNALDKGDGFGVYNPNCSYTAAMNGTSSAAPTVSGVVALMLQAKPALTWRDVKHILASTARRVNPSSNSVIISDYFGGASLTAEQGWVLNAGNYYYHNWYGFGLVNAAAAVAMAQVYPAGSVGTYQSATVDAPIVSTNIPDASITGLTKPFSVGGAPATVEQAELMLHFASGFVPRCHQIELQSPSGTKSILLNMNTAHSAASTNGVRFLSNAFYGEPSAGTWNLKFINACTGASQNLSASVAQQLTIRGH